MGRSQAELAAILGSRAWEVLKRNRRPPVQAAQREIIDEAVMTFRQLESERGGSCSPQITIRVQGQKLPFRGQREFAPDPGCRCAAPGKWRMGPSAV
jgi:hypothetical protein